MVQFNTGNLDGQSKMGNQMTTRTLAELAEQKEAEDYESLQLKFELADQAKVEMMTSFVKRYIKKYAEAKYHPSAIRHIGRNKFRVVCPIRGNIVIAEICDQLYVVLDHGEQEYLGDDQYRDVVAAEVDPYRYARHEGPRFSVEDERVYITSKKSWTEV